MSGAVEKIENLKGGVIKLGTGNTRGLLTRLGSPDDGLKIIHVAGTNGKGSTAEYITRILIAAGRKTGTFTSPAVMNFGDQIRIDGEPLGSEKLEKYLGEALASAGDCTSFEVLTAGALNAFFKEGCEYAVLECGMGGLYDATNAVNGKELAVITSIGLEHTAFLGNTIEQICAHKAGIIKNCPAVVSALQPAEALEYFKNTGAVFADKPLKILGSDRSSQRFSYDGKEYTLNMAGSAQAYNAALAIEAARLLNIDEEAISEGISKAKIAGRLQFFSARGRTFIVDGCHNPSGFVPLKEVLGRFDPGDVTLVFGCLADKDIDGNLKTLKGLAKRIIAVKPDSPRAMDGDKIYSACKKYFGTAETADGVSRALDKSEGTTVVCGSFTLVKEAVNWIEKRL